MVLSNPIVGQAYAQVWYLIRLFISILEMDAF